MYAPTTFFFGLEKKTREKKHLHYIKLSNGRETTDQKEINATALSFYEKLYQAESCDESAVDERLCRLPQIAEPDKMDLESSLKFFEISRAILEMNPGKSPGIDGLTAEFY